MNLYIFIILLLVNSISCTAFGIDKRKAIKNQWRISEKNPFTIIICWFFWGISWYESIPS